MHRFDFCKPVGWHDMSPVTEGKYSVEVYLEALDTCYKTLRAKVNGRELLKMTDYNAFHTGGGYHIVRKAFERLLRCEVPGLLSDQKEIYVNEKLHPSVSLLKIIGPCHTVSSFLNTSSICMNMMDNLLGKVVMVFTYGSGCASSMYQMRCDEVPFFDHLEVWKISFYRHSIFMRPAETMIHQAYVDTWMKFNYVPLGRRLCNIPIQKYEKDVYYLMEIDHYGRRFYHRGGLRVSEAPESLPVDEAEARYHRTRWPTLMKEDEDKLEDTKEAEKSLEQVWMEIEYEMTYDVNAEKDNYETKAIYNDRYHRETEILVYREAEDLRDRHGKTIVNDGQPHTYQIVGTWAKDMEDMSLNQGDGTWTYDITIGENRWEQFHLVQDYDLKKRIIPHKARSGSGVACVGPYNGAEQNEWLLDCRDRVTVPDWQEAMPGQKFRVTFKWEQLKNLTWEKLEGETGSWERGKYFISGSWNDWDLKEMTPDPDREEGWFVCPEVPLTSLGIEFNILRNGDPRQRICPEPPRSVNGKTSKYDEITGPDDAPGQNWNVEGAAGGVYKISFFRDQEDCEGFAMEIDWEKTEDRPAAELPPRLYVVSRQNNWGDDGYLEMTVNPSNPSIYTAKIEMMDKVEPFKILDHKLWSRCIHPDKEACTQLMSHKVLNEFVDQDAGEGKAWHIGKHSSDKAKAGDTFQIKYEVKSDGSVGVTWAKSL